MHFHEPGNLKGGTRVFRWDESQDKAVELMVVEAGGQGPAFVQVPAALANGGVTFVQGIHHDQIYLNAIEAIEYGLRLIDEKHARRREPIVKALAEAQARR